MFIFHVPYTLAQYAGLGFLFSLYIFQGLKFIMYDLPKEKKRAAAVKQEVERVDKALLEAHSRGCDTRNESTMAAALGTSFKVGFEYEDRKKV